MFKVKDKMQSLEIPLYVGVPMVLQSLQIPLYGGMPMVLQCVSVTAVWLATPQPPRPNGHPSVEGNVDASILHQSSNISWPSQ